MPWAQWIRSGEWASEDKATIPMIPANVRELVVLAVDGVEVGEAVEDHGIRPQLAGDVAHEAGEVGAHPRLGGAKGERVTVPGGVLDAQFRVRESKGRVVAADDRGDHLQPALPGGGHGGSTRSPS